MGTPDLEVLAKIAGACPSLERDMSDLELAYMAEFAALITKK